MFVQLAIANQIFSDRLVLVILAGLMLLEVSDCFAQSDPSAPPIDLGEEYSEYSKTPGKKVPTGGKANSGDSSLALSVLLYLPNRFLDFVDIVHLDLGLGCSYGAVLRVTKWGQAGNRQFCPGSLRVGLNGRKSPIYWETKDAKGVGTDYRESNRRTVNSFELGVGADALLVGGYFGFSVDELFDFLFGIVGFDFKEDDLE